MKLNGTFALREIAGEILVVPVGNTALSLNGMIVLNAVSKVIWESLEQDADRDEMLKRITEQFDVSEAVAKKDLDAFLKELAEHKLIV